MNWYYSTIFKKYAVSLNYVQEVNDYLRENPRELYLNDIFGDKMRVAFPLETKAMRSLVSQLEQVGYSVNLQDQLVSKEIQTRQGPKIQKKKMGKAIKEELSPEWLKVYSEWADAKRNGDNDIPCTVILSRAPIDVLRMSDHDNIESCHSEGDSYFSCAVKEAKHGGAIAYVVPSEELRGVD